MDTYGTISYASQEPWIFSGTIKENILFGKPFNNIWFDQVVECCSLVKVKIIHFFEVQKMVITLKDIKEMPFGDETLIGERGVNLSGGQKARVNLARCVLYGFIVLNVCSYLC